MDLEMIRKLKECCEREYKLRISVYPKLIATGKMTKEKADEEIRLMKLCAMSFDKILQGNAPKIQQQLFNIEDYQKRKSMYDYE